MRKTILFYSPFNQRSRDTETLMLAFHQRGHNVISLSQQEGALINDFLKKKGIEAHSYVVPESKKGIRKFLNHLIFFVKFCWKHRVNIVFSHLEFPSFVSSVGQFFIKAKVIICRHHINEAALYHFDGNLSYRLTYKLAKRIIVVSEHAKRYMIAHEKANPAKIHHINLAYDFSLYQAPSPKRINEIRKQLSSQLLLIFIGRLTTYKRPDQAIYLTNELLKRGIDTKLIILGKGEMYSSLEKTVERLALQRNVFLLGHVQNVLDYISAADFLVHPSLLESSCVVVKEAGLVGTPVIVCQGIGDFDQIVENGINSFSVSQSKFVEDSLEVIQEKYHNNSELKEMGEKLRVDCFHLFGIENVIGEYTKMIKDL